MIGYLTMACNLISCPVMILVFRLVSRVLKQSKLKASEINCPLESNNAVILAHVVLVTLYTILSVLTFNLKSTDGSTASVRSLTVCFRWNSAWTFVGGIADLYISCTLLIVTDENQTPVAFRQASKVY